MRSHDMPSHRKAVQIEMPTTTTLSEYLNEESTDAIEAMKKKQQPSEALLLPR